MMVVEWAMMMIGWVDGWAVDDATRFTGGRTQMCGEYPAGTHHFLSSLVLAPTTGFFTTGPTNLGWPIFSGPTNLVWPTWFDQLGLTNFFRSDQLFPVQPTWFDQFFSPQLVHEQLLPNKHNGPSLLWPLPSLVWAQHWKIADKIQTSLHSLCSLATVFKPTRFRLVLNKKHVFATAPFSLSSPSQYKAKLTNKR